MRRGESPNASIEGRGAMTGQHLFVRRPNMPFLDPMGSDGGSPFRLLVDARAYARAARDVKDAEEERGARSAPHPAYHLMGHALELALKAWLAGTGIPSGALARKPYGHDLNELLRAAEARKLARVVRLWEEQRQAIRMMGDQHVTHAHRYVVPGPMTVPYWKLLELAIATLLQGLRPYCLRLQVGRKMQRELDRREMCWPTTAQYLTVLSEVGDKPDANRYSS